MHCTLTSTFWGLQLQKLLIRVMFLLTRISEACFFHYVSLQLAPRSLAPSAFSGSRYCTLNLFLRTAVWLICQNTGELFLPIFLKAIRGLLSVLEKQHRLSFVKKKIKEKKKKKDEVWDLKRCAPQNSSFENESRVEAKILSSIINHNRWHFLFSYRFEQRCEKTIVQLRRSCHKFMKWDEGKWRADCSDTISARRSLWVLRR